MFISNLDKINGRVYIPHHQNELMYTSSNEIYLSVFGECIKLSTLSVCEGRNVAVMCLCV